VVREVGPDLVKPNSTERLKAKRCALRRPTRRSRLIQTATVAASVSFRAGKSESAMTGLGRQCPLPLPPAPPPESRPPSAHRNSRRPARSLVASTRPRATGTAEFAGNEDVAVGEESSSSTADVIPTGYLAKPPDSQARSAEHGSTPRPLRTKDPLATQPIRSQTARKTVSPHRPAPKAHSAIPGRLPDRCGRKTAHARIGRRRRSL